VENVNLKIHVVPNGVALMSLKDTNPEDLGGYLSTATTVRVTKVRDGYSVVYPDNVFVTLDSLRTVNYIVKLFTSRLPGKVICIGLEYHFELKNGRDLFNEDVGELLSDMDDLLIEVGNNMSVVDYERTDSMEDVLDILMDGDDEDGEEDEDPDYDDDDEDFDPEDIGGLLNMIVRDGSRSNRKKKKYKADYGESEVLHETKNAKRCYNRHGVMVCSDKDALKHDQKVIKEFLKDFVPGTAEWKKDFRRDLMKRWMQMYVISKKQLKHLQKKHQKSKGKKRGGIDADKVLDFTRRAFNVSANSSAWNDPNR